MKSRQIISLFLYVCISSFGCTYQVFSQINTPVIASRELDSISRYYKLSKSDELTYERRLSYIDSFLEKAELYKSDSLVYLGLMRKTKLLGEIRKYDEAVLYSKQLLRVAVNNKDTLYISKALTKLGIYHKRDRKFHEAFRYLNNSYRISRIIGDSLTMGKNLLQMANIQTFLGDYLGSRTSALEGVKYIKESNDIRSLSGLYHIISVSNRHQKRYEEAKKYNSKAIDLARDSATIDKIGLKNILIFKNTKALIHANEGNYDDAIVNLKKMISNPVIKNDLREYSRILGNLGYVKWLQNNENVESKNILLTSLEIREKISDAEGLNTVNIYLTKYYLNNNNSKALKYAESAYQNALQLGSLTSIIESLGYIFQLKDNVTEEAKVYHETYQKLNEINQSNREIYAVTKYENEQLEQQNIQLAKKNNTMTGYMNVAAVLLVLSMIGIGYYAYQRHQYKKRFNAVLARQQNHTTNTIATKPNPNPGIKELPASMSQETLDHLRNALEQFEAQEHYLAPDINVHTLAQKFNSNTSYVSMVINADKQKTMNQYINDLRIDYAITRLQQDKVFRKYTVKAIAQDIGFNSAENFAKKFYKKTGIYPSYYIKKLNEDV
ncbi:helix-turn-helix transcriptional regulator [Aquimarina sp. U1-2]|uniref:helix-turn-helix domain-containing protein n=1 Tax=Aquimarina sp. U1-2 TaxID=2823141 RepID=UPI001AECC6F7|nr:AraC family transcriptional regulator [Aquimarina sp. U1-2]MBP2832823.1 helix-turn-helix transcriptional regulator [Aquimarina sp. U1-2]